MEHKVKLFAALAVALALVALLSLSDLTLLIKPWLCNCAAEGAARQQWNTEAGDAAANTQLQQAQSATGPPSGGNLLPNVAQVPAPAPDAEHGADEVDAWPTEQAGRRQVTVLLNTFNRPVLFRRSVRHWTACSVVARLHVNWAESTTPPNVTEHVRGPMPVTFALPLLTHNDSSLNTRFLPVDDLTTQAVLVVDDDVYVPCGEVQRALTMWRGAPDQLVGWHERHACERSDGGLTYLQRLRRPVVYGIVLTKAAVMHARYLAAYTQELPRWMHDFVAENRNCEDLAMQYLISSQVGEPPWALGTENAGPQGVEEPGGRGKGIWKGPDHVKLRNQCLTMLRDYYGMDLPARSKGGLRVKAADALRPCPGAAPKHDHGSSNRSANDMNTTGARTPALRRRR